MPSRSGNVVQTMSSIQFAARVAVISSSAEAVPTTIAGTTSASSTRHDTGTTAGSAASAGSGLGSAAGAPRCAASASAIDSSPAAAVIAEVRS